MSLFNSKTFTITRSTEGGLNLKGRWVAGTDSTFSATGTIQPSSGFKVQSLIEGKKLTGIYEIFTATELLIADPKTKNTGDLIEIHGENYLLIHGEIWDNGIIPHNAYIAVKPKELA